MLQESGARVVVYQVLDQILADGTVAAHSRGAMFCVIDNLREGPGSLEDLRRAEHIAVEMHKLEWALQRGDAAASATALDELRALAARWLDSRICN